MSLATIAIVSVVCSVITTLAVRALTLWLSARMMRRALAAPPFNVDAVIEHARMMMPPTAACLAERHAECERPRQCSCACHATHPPV